MTKNEALCIASIAIEKKMDYETLKYSDYLYGNEDKIDNVWSYVEEFEMIGSKAWYEKYKGYDIY